MRNVKFPLTLLLLSLFLYNCQKNEAENNIWLENFLDDKYIFKENTNLVKPDLLESRSLQEMEQNVKTYFKSNSNYAKKLEAKFGYPVWAHANYFGGVEKVYSVPFSKVNEKFTDTYLIAIINPDAKNLLF